MESSDGSEVNATARVTQNPIGVPDDAQNYVKYPR